MASQQVLVTDVIYFSLVGEGGTQKVLFSWGSSAMRFILYHFTRALDKKLTLSCTFHTKWYPSHIHVPRLLKPHCMR